MFINGLVKGLAVFQVSLHSFTNEKPQLVSLDLDIIWIKLTVRYFFSDETQLKNGKMAAVSVVSY